MDMISSWIGSNILGEKKEDEVVKADTEVAKDPQQGSEMDTVVEVSEKKESAESVGSRKSAEPVVVEENKKEDPDDGTSSDKENGAGIPFNMQTAKEFGGFLFNVGKKATKTALTTAASTAQQIKTVVGDKTILSDFNAEQEKFVSERRENMKSGDAAVPPWLGYDLEDTMKKKILALSKDKRNFLRNPPGGVSFQFDFEESFPVAMATLAEDPNLHKMRFELVPKKIKEEMFWRNYFYRVSLIKQSSQVSSMIQDTGSSTGDATASSKSSSRRSSMDESDKEKMQDVVAAEAAAAAARLRVDSEELAAIGSPPQQEFASDAFAEKEPSDEEMKQARKQLGMDDKDSGGKKAASSSARQKSGDAGNEDTDDLDLDEIQRELDDYEVVDDEGSHNNADWENELQDMLDNDDEAGNK